MSRAKDEALLGARAVNLLASIMDGLLRGIMQDEARRLGVANYPSQREQDGDLPEKRKHT